MGLVTLQEETAEGWLSHSAMGGYSEKAAICMAEKEFSSEHNHVGILISDSQPPEI